MARYVMFLVALILVVVTSEAPQQDRSLRSDQGHAFEGGTSFGFEEGNNVNFSEIGKNRVRKSYNYTDPEGNQVEIFFYVSANYTDDRIEEPKNEPIFELPV